MYWFIFISNHLILRKDGEVYTMPQSEEPPIAIKPWTHIQVLPDIGETPCRAFTLTTPPKDGLPEEFTTMELRASYNVLPHPIHNMAGKAAELLYWDDNTRYCGHCGAPMERATDISKRCTHCGKEVWPQVSPAIIVRIRKEAVIDTNGHTLEPEKILLVHARNFRHSERYGLVAGFVETGETLEQCVEREVMEETQLRITHLRYFGSQPWPYPSGIMVGFTADYESGTIHLQDEELSRGGWFDRQHLPDIPDKMSIARQLIDDWLVKG